MRTRTSLLVVGGVIVALAGSSCGGDEDAEAVPTADELAADLLAPEDLEGAWSVMVFPDGDDEVDTSDVVTDEIPLGGA